MSRDELQQEGHWVDFAKHERIREMLLNAQRTVQAFRAINQQLRQENFEVHSACGEALINGAKLIAQRDNARAALEQSQKLNAALREQLETADSECEKAFDELNAQTDKQSLFRHHSLTDDLRRTREQLATVTAQRDRALDAARWLRDFREGTSRHTSAKTWINRLEEEIEKDAK